MDAERHVNPECLYRTVYDLDDLLETCVPPSQVDGSEEDRSEKDHDKVTDVKDTLIFRATSESCNLRKAIQVFMYFNCSL